MFNKKEFKKIWNQIRELKLSLSTMQLLYDSISERLNKEDGEKNKGRMQVMTTIEGINRRVYKVERITESDSNSIVNLSNKLGEKDIMIKSLREEVEEVRAVVKEFLKISGHQVEMVKNENYMNAHSIKVTKIANQFKKKI